MKEPKQRLVVQKGWLEPFVKSLRGKGIRVIAPVECGAAKRQPADQSAASEGSSTGSDGAVEFRDIDTVEEMAQDYINTRVPLKEVLSPRTEVILDFDQPSGGDVAFRGVEVDIKPTVVIGARPCDLSAVGVFDEVFNWDYSDKLYRDRRENTTMIGVACSYAYPECFCDSVGGGAADNAGSDIFVRPTTGGGAVLEVITERGEELAKAFIGGAQATGDEELAPTPAATAPFDVDKVKTWLDDNFDHEFWQDASLRCLGCGACSYLCPTCHCFDIVDESDWRSGERRRNWDCCSFAQFTLHTSGHNPRPDQPSRCRNRVMHKFKYFVERFGRRACVGCGRCTRICGAGLSIVNMLIEMERAET